MSVPEYVPLGFADRVRRPESEMPPLPTRRVACDHPGGPSSGSFGRLQGRPAPDAGYGLHLARRFAGQVVLAPGEDERDALSAGAVLGMARASHFGRGPIAADVRVGLELLGYLGGAPEDLVQWRRRALRNIHRDRFRQLQLLGADPEVLEMAPGEANGVLGDWRRLLPPELPGVRPEAPDAVSHRQLATVLGDGRDPVRVQRFVHELAQHLTAERDALGRLPANRWAVIERGQSRLLAEAAALEEELGGDRASAAAAAVIDRLALQALAEDEALEHLAHEAKGGEPARRPVSGGFPTGRGG